MNTDQARIDRKLAKRATHQTEAQFQAQVRQLATMYGWLDYHTQDSRSSTAGFPDLTLVRDGCLIFAELKTASPTSKKGTVTAEQGEWLDELTRAGITCYVWRPAMLQLVAGILRDGPTDGDSLGGLGGRWSVQA